jgi:hypothetical protein
MLYHPCHLDFVQGREHWCVVDFFDGKDGASLLVCDVGLNLTACNNVILVDLWWNPALEVSALVPRVFYIYFLLSFRIKLSTDLIVLDKHAM